MGKTLKDLPQDTVERIKTQTAGLKWLYEMELLSSPQLVNNLKLNIFARDKSIKDVELLVDQNNHGILIYINLSWWGKTFKKSKIVNDITDIISQLLPSYRMRIVTEKWIFNLALQKAREIIGGNYEKINPVNSLVDGNDKPKSESRRQLSETPNLLPDSEE